MNILIADDEIRDRTWLKELLSSNLSNINSIQEATDGKQAIDLAIKLKPSLVFLDIKMPHLSGISAAEKIFEALPETGIIILSNFADEIYVRQIWKIAPKNSAFAYVLKNASNEQVIEAANAVLAGDCWIHPGIVSIVERAQDRSQNLSPAEYEALIGIALGLTDHAIAQSLYLTEKAIQSRLKSLYLRLGIPTKASTEEGKFNHRCRAVYLAWCRGLINQSELASWEKKILKQRQDIK